MKKRRVCQTSISTHPVPTAEANGKRVEIIATFYTAGACADAAIFADRSKVKKASLLGTEDRIIVQIGVCSNFKKLRGGRLL